MADVLSGTGSAIRIEASIDSSDAAGIWWDVSWRISFFERVSSPSTFGSASYIVGGTFGVVASGGFSFDWTPGGLQSVVMAFGTTRVYGNPDGTPPASFHVDGYVSNTGTSGGGAGGTAVEYLTLPTLKVLPGVPSPVSAVRNSDTQATVSWAQPAASNGAPTSQKVRKKANGGAFDAGTTIAPATSVALAVAANQKIVFGVQAINAAGSTAWSSDTTPIYTTPAAPTSVVATKTGSDIVLTWTPNVAFTEHQHLIEHGVDVAGVVTWDGSTLATITAGTSTYTHTAPNPAQRHIYRVWAKNTDVGALISTKVSSNVVQLLAAPAKPSVASPAPFQDKAATFRFAWAHNPVDSSAQTKRQTRYSLNGGSTWTTGSKTASTDEFLDYAGSTWTANQAVTFAVRTKGAYDSGSDGDASYSPWSDNITVTFKTKPTATITAPANGGTYTQAALNVVLGFSQPESATFVSATIGLYASGGVTLLEEITSNTLAGTAFATRLADSTSYVVKATVTDSNGITSSQVTSSFAVDYTEPVAAGVTLTYLPDLGWVQIDLVIPAAGGGFVDATSVTIDRTIDGVTERVFTNYAVAPTLTLLDTTPTTVGDNDYTITTTSVDGATTLVLASITTNELVYGFMSKGSGYPNVIRFACVLTLTAAPTVDATLLKAAGRSRPIGLYAPTGNLDVSGTGDVDESDGSTAAEIEAFLLVPGKVCYRDPSGRRMFGTVTGSVTRDSGTSALFPYTVTETA